MARPRKSVTPNVGERFSDWIFVSEYRRAGRIRWECTCSVCNKQFEVSPYHLTSGASRRCERCSDIDRGRTTHYFSALGKTSIRNKWRVAYFNMMLRCYDNKATGYPHYGGRGITVDPELQDQRKFAEFIRTLDGWDNPNLSLDRIDVNGNYSKANLRLATRSQQSSNRRLPIACKNGHQYAITGYRIRLRKRPNSITRERVCIACR